MRSLSVEKAVKSENQNGRKRRGVAKKCIALLVLAVIVMAFLASCGSSASLKNAKIGSYITFGHYEQDGDTSNGEEAIEWLVLDKQEDKILVVSKYALDCKPYNDEWKEDVTWETCTLRTWLNSDFYNSAFSSEEKAKIPTVTVSTENNPDSGRSGGKDTQDKVFALSISEVNMYFSSDKSAECTATDLLLIREEEVDDADMMNEYRQLACRWWLRTPGKQGGCATWFYNSVEENCVEYNQFGHRVDYGIVLTLGVRPAMWIDLGA